MKILLIIPVFNRKEFTRNCLESLRQQTFKDFKVVVIDDGSTDGTFEMLAEEFPEVHVIKGNGSLWWTKATNLGVKYALENNADYVLTLNNDTLVNADYLSNLVNWTKTDKKALFGSVAVSVTDKKNIVDGGVKINWCTAKYTFLNRNKVLKELKVPTLAPVDALSGRGMLIPREAFDKISLFNSNLPQYAADYEFSIRALQNGFKLYVAYNCPVFTYVEETGINNERKKINWIELLKSFFSIKSPYALKYRLIFAMSVVPKHCLLTYLLFDFTRLIFGRILNQYIK